MSDALPEKPLVIVLLDLLFWASLGFMVTYKVWGDRLFNSWTEVLFMGLIGWFSPLLFSS